MTAHMTEQCAVDIQIKSEPIDDGYGDNQDEEFFNECSDSITFRSSESQGDANIYGNNKNYSARRKRQPSHLICTLGVKSKDSNPTNDHLNNCLRPAEHRHSDSRQTSDFKSVRSKTDCNVHNEELPSCDIKSEPITHEDPRQDFQSGSSSLSDFDSGVYSEQLDRDGHVLDTQDMDGHARPDEEDLEFNSYSDYQKYLDSIEKGRNLPKEGPLRKKKRKYTRKKPLKSAINAKKASPRKNKVEKASNTNSLQTVPFECLKRVEICTPVPGGKVLRLEKGIVRLEDNLYAEPMNEEQVFKSPFDNRSQNRSVAWRTISKNARALTEGVQSNCDISHQGIMGNSDDSSGQIHQGIMGNSDDSSGQIGKKELWSDGMEEPDGETDAGTTRETSDLGDTTVQKRSHINHDVTGDIQSQNRTVLDKSNQIFVDRKFNHKCFTCGRIFELEEELENHLKEDHGAITLHSCNKCDKVFERYALLLRHLQEHENQSSNHVCKYCGSNFDDKASLVNHLAVHPQAKRFQCDLCQKWFKTPWTLKKHVSLHQDTRTYECPVCKYVFNRNIVDKHLRSVHPDELVYNRCVDCDEEFEVLTEFHQHVKSKHIKCEVLDEDAMSQHINNEESVSS